MAVASPLKWHGGKSYLATKIVALTPKHLHYVEPFAGGLSVLFAKDPEGVSEVVNDIYSQLTMFWRVLQNDKMFEIFRREIEATPFSEVEFNGATQLFDESEPVACAINFFIRCRQSLAGRMQDFAPLSRTRTRRGMNEQASAWLTAIEGLPAVHARLKRVIVLNRNAIDVIRQQDGPATLYYCDPPYVHETRASPDAFAYEMDENAHRLLLDTLSGIEGKFMLSGYRSALYDATAEARGWRRHDFDLPNNAAGGEAKRRMVESLWCNF